MANINIDKNTISDLVVREIKNIKVFFYSSGCAGTKVNIEENPYLSDLELLENID
jgi:sporulation protein YlmC with PRC-barrel domain